MYILYLIFPLSVKFISCKHPLSQYGHIWIFILTCSLSFLIKQPKNFNLNIEKGCFYETQKHWKLLQVLAIIFCLKQVYPKFLYFIFAARARLCTLLAHKTENWEILLVNLSEPALTKQLLQALHSCGFWSVLYLLSPMYSGANSQLSFWSSLKSRVWIREMRY